MRISYLIIVMGVSLASASLIGCASAPKWDAYELNTTKVVAAMVRVDKSLIKELVEFNHRATGLPIPKGKIPIVRQVSECELTNWLYMDYKSGCQELKEEGVTLEGGYDSNKILLNENLDLKTSWGQSVLAHELVHWMQDKSGQNRHTVDNICYLEPLAYKTQQKYLRSKGEKPAAYGIDNKFVRHMVARCD